MWRELAEMSYLWRVPHALDGTALHAAVGALPATPIDAALRAALLDLGFGARPAAWLPLPLDPHTHRFPTEPGAFDEHLDPDADAQPAHASSAPSFPARGLGLLLIAEALLSFAPVLILGAAIGWPASLDKPAAEQLAAIGRQRRCGGAGLRRVPAVFGPDRAADDRPGRALFRRPAQPAGADGGRLRRAVGAGARHRHPALADGDAGAGHGACRRRPGARAQIELVFSAVTDYGGGIGEILGVSLFMALSLGTLCVAALLRGGLPKWLAALGGFRRRCWRRWPCRRCASTCRCRWPWPCRCCRLWMLCAGVWLLRKR